MLLYFCMRATPRSAQSLTTFISRTNFAAAWQSGRLSHSCGSDFRNSDGRCNISKNRREDEVTKLAIDLSPTSDISRLMLWTQRRNSGAHGAENSIQISALARIEPRTL